MVVLQQFDSVGANCSIKLQTQNFFSLE